MTMASFKIEVLYFHLAHDRYAHMYEFYPWLEKFNNAWAFERILKSPTALAKRMFGGAAVYDRGQLLLLLMESPGENVYRGKKYAFDLWNGVFLPTSREHHQALLAEVPSAVSHPVLGKWLYIPEDSENFEEDVRRALLLIARESELIGVTPKPRRARRRRSARSSAVKKRTNAAKTHRAKK